MTELQCLTLYDAIERERKILEIVTAEEREDGNRDGWATARIKIRELGDIIQQVRQGLALYPRGVRALSPEAAADLAERVEYVGQKMRPPRAELERQMSVKARRRAAVRQGRPAESSVTEAGQGDSSTAAEAANSAVARAPWAAPKYE